MSSNATNAEVFIYTGPWGDAVPQDVERVRVDPSVTTIPADAFYQQKQLTEVELCEGLVEIGGSAFTGCGYSITTINIPTSLRRIRDHAFNGSLQCPIRLHDDIENIGDSAFRDCIFTNFRVPPLITVIPHDMLAGCRATFSVEMPSNVTEIGDYALFNCPCLRNVAFPSNAVIGNNILDGATDLLQLFGSDERMLRNLKLRFDGLLIHFAVYYESYRGELQRLITSGNELDPTGNHQDCLGMTPLHILMCSSVHNLELYRLIVAKYPTNLITEDRWGALPLLYAFWGGAPAEIIQFLLESYQSLYPNHNYWTMMVETMGRCDTPSKRIENLLYARQLHFPDQSIDWVYLLNKFAQPSRVPFYGALFQERMRFLFTCGMADHVEALKFRLWRDHITSIIHTSNFQHNGDNRSILREIRAKLDHFDDELPKLKDVTTILELALWKMNMSKNGHQDRATQSQQKMTADDSIIRSQNRVTCGADVVIGHVLPFLINTDGFFD
jgi:hypothetical protein